MATDESSQNAGGHSFFLEEHHSQLTDNMFEMMECGHFSDVTLKAGGKEFKCHKLILSSACPYFKAMFSLPFEENQNNDVEIKEIERHTMDCLIEYMYKGRIQITVDNAQDIIFAADMFQLDALKQECSLFLQRQMKTFNCLGMWNIARQLQMDELEEKAWDCVISYFPRVADQEEFLQLDLNDLCFLLLDPRLSMTSEEIACKSALNWMLYASERKTHVKSVMKCIRLTELSPVFIKTNLMTNSLFKNLPHWRIFFQDLLDHLTMNMPCRSEVSNLSVRNYTETSIGIMLLGGKVSRPMSRTQDCNFVTLNNGEEITERNQTMVRQNLICQLPSTHKYTASCSQGNTIYISGMGSNLKGFMKFDSSLQWTKCKSMRTSRNGHNLLSGFTNYLYAIGGTEVASDVAHNITSVEEYNVTHNSWHSIGSLSLPVCYAGAMFYSGKIFVMGGFMSNRSACNRIQMFDTQTRVCVKLETRLPRTMAYCKGLVVRETLLLVDKEMTLVFKGNNMIGNHDEDYEEETPEHASETVTDEERDCDLDLSVGDPEDDPLHILNLSPNDDSQNTGESATQLDEPGSSYNNHSCADYTVKTGCGVELAAVECLGDKLIAFGGRKDARDCASNRILSRAIRAADVDEFLCEGKQPVWKLIGKLQCPMIVFMIARIKLKV